MSRLSPKHGETYHLRLLLFDARGCESLQDLLTFEGMIILKSMQMFYNLVWWVDCINKDAKYSYVSVESI